MASHKDVNNDQDNSLATVFKAPFVEKTDSSDRKTKLVLFSFISSAEPARDTPQLTDSAA